MKKTFLFLLFMVIITSCAKIKYSGDIVDKIYEPEDWYIMCMPMIISDGKTTTIIPMWYWIYDDPDWIIKIRYYDFKRNKDRTKIYYVNKDTYEKYKLGDLFDTNIENTFWLSDKRVTKDKATEQDVEKYGSQDN